MEDFVPKHMPVIRIEKRAYEDTFFRVGGQQQPTFAETCGLPPITECGGRWKLASPREYREAESYEKVDPAPNRLRRRGGG
jgi:hypothetical protein